MRHVLCLATFAVGLGFLSTAAVAADGKDTPKAAKTRELLKSKVTLSFKMEFLKDILEEIQDQAKGVKFKVDSKGGVSQNRRMTVQCKDVPLEQALDQLLGKEELGYIVISDPKNAYDGSIFIKMGKERGYPAK